MLWRHTILLSQQSCNIWLRSPNWNISGPLRHLLHTSNSVGISNPSIANILATPPSDPPDTLTAIGFVRTVRSQKAFSFIQLGDGSTPHTLQVIVHPDFTKGLGTGASIAVTGKWRPCPKGKEQPAELDAHEVFVLGGADAETYPIQKKYHSAEYLRTIPHLRLRTTLSAVVVRLKSECEFKLSQYFHDNGFLRVQPPVITSSDCEGGGDVFLVSSAGQGLESESEAPTESFFRTPKFLTVSSQLHLEAFVHEHRKVWTLSPTFRAEKSDTPRHLSEFWMLEAEIQTENLKELLDLVEEMLRNLVQSLSSTSLLKDLAFARQRVDVLDVDGTHNFEALEERWRGVLRRSWPRITYAEAVDLVLKATQEGEMTFQHQVSPDHGLYAEHEKYIAACVGQGSPVFVTEYPANIKPFYMLPSQQHETSDEPATAACFDLLLPDGSEVVGGSLREHRLDNLSSAMRLRKAQDLDATVQERGSASDSSIDLDWYLDLRRYGSVPHGGFGLGYDRLVGYLAGIHNIRDVVSWPRHYGRCDG